MIKIQNGIATREPIPAFLIGLLPESLIDLSWTDPALGVSDCAWWPEQDVSPALGEFQRYGAETLTMDVERQIVLVERAVVPFEQAEIDAIMAERAAALQASVVNATQARLDAFAATRNYDGILSACTYATSGVPRFASEGQAAVAARDATWAKLYSILGEVKDGKRPAPAGFADIEAELPLLEWPA